MAKLGAVKLFEFAQVANSDAGKAMKPFIDFVNTNFEALLRAMNRSLTVGDNLKSQELTVSLTHNTAQELSVNSTDIAGILPMRIISTTSDSTSVDAFRSLAWYFNSSNKLVVVPEFKLGTTTKRDCKLLVLFN